MSETRLTADELRALLALGVLASFAVIFQLAQVHTFSIVFGSNATQLQAQLEDDTMTGDSALFGAYVALFCVAIGFDSFGRTKGVSEPLRSLANVFFLLGAFGLFVVGAAFVYRIL